MSENTGELVKDIIERIRTGIEKDGEIGHERYALQLVDQMALAEAAVDIQTICQKEGWFTAMEKDSEIKMIYKLPTGFQYEENPGAGMLPEIVPTSG